MKHQTRGGYMSGSKKVGDLDPPPGGLRTSSEELPSVVERPKPPPRPWEEACMICGKSPARFLIINAGKGAYCFEHFLEANPVVWWGLGMR